MRKSTAPAASFYIVDAPRDGDEFNRSQQRNFVRSPRIEFVVDKAARLMWSEVDKRKDGQAEVRKEIEAVSGKSAKGLLPRWLYGDQRPGTQWALDIETALGIAARLWFEQPRRAFTPPAVREARRALKRAAKAAPEAA